MRIDGKRTSGAKARKDSIDLIGMTEVMPFYKAVFGWVFINLCWNPTLVSFKFL
jgi:hypothetical protein